MTVRELVEHLLTGDQDAVVARFGYFGELYPMTKHDFSFEELQPGDNPSISEGSFLRVDPPYIGQEPE